MQIRKLIIMAIRYDSCADPGIFVGGGGGRGGGFRSIWHKKQRLLLIFFLVLNLFTEVQWLLSKTTIIFQGSSGVDHFPRGSNFFQGGGGVQLFFPYTNPYNL